MPTNATLERRRQYAREYYQRNRKQRQKYAREYYHNRRRQVTPETPPVRASRSLLSRLKLAAKAVHLILTNP